MLSIPVVEQSYLIPVNTLSRAKALPIDPQLGANMNGVSFGGAAAALLSLRDDPQHNRLLTIDFPRFRWCARMAA